jgi:hypothetical protein
LALYESLLGEAFGSLDLNVRRAHAVPLIASGTLDVEHGSHWVVPLLVALLRLPAAGQGLHARLTVVGSGDGLEWDRRIGSSVVRTRERAIGSRLVEQLGLGRIAFDLQVDDGALVYRQAWMGIGAIRIPRAVSPRVSARVAPAPGGWRVDVDVTWRGHPVCHYGGVMALA